MLPTNRLQPRVTVPADYYVYEFPLDFTAASESLSASKVLLSGGDFELYYLVSSHPNEFVFNIMDTSSNEYVFRDFCSSVNLLGDGQYPMILPVSRIFAGNRTIRIDARNGLIAANAGSIYLVGATLRSGAAAQPPASLGEYTRNSLARNDVRAEFTAYNVDIAFSLPGQIITDTIEILNDKPFELYYLNMNHDRVWPWKIQIEDSSSGKTLFNTPVDTRTICGTGKLPGVLPITRPFRANGNITITAYNDPAVAFNAGELALIGANLIGV